MILSMLMHPGVRVRRFQRRRHHWRTSKNMGNEFNHLHLSSCYLDRFHPAPGPVGSRISRPRFAHRDRPEVLQRALRSLILQETSPKEVLVVDNAPSTDSTRRLVEREFPMVRYFREPLRDWTLRESRYSRGHRRSCGIS